MTVATTIQTYPFASLLTLSLFITLFTTLIYKYTTNQQKLKSMKEEIKNYQREMKNHKDNPQKMMDLQKSAMDVNLQYMKHTLKPMIITLLPFIFLFSWLSGVYSKIGNNITGNATGKILIPVLSFHLGWIWVYIISSLVFSLVLRKILKVY